MRPTLTATVTGVCGHPIEVAVPRAIGLRRSMHTYNPITRTCKVCKRKASLVATVRPDHWADREFAGRETYAIVEVDDVTAWPHVALTITAAERADRHGNPVEVTA